MCQVKRFTQNEESSQKLRNTFCVGVHLKLAPQVSDLTKFSFFFKKKLVWQKNQGDRNKNVIFFGKNSSFVAVSSCCDMWSSMLQENFAVFASVLHVIDRDRRKPTRRRNCFLPLTTMMATPVLVLCNKEKFFVFPLCGNERKCR